MANVLLVDDDMTYRMLMERLLEKEGHCVLLAECAETAMELVNQRPSWADVIVTDYQMPGDDGIKFMKNYQSAYPQIPFIVMSASFTTKEEGAYGSYRIPKSEPLTITEYVGKITS